MHIRVMGKAVSWKPSGFKKQKISLCYYITVSRALSLGKGDIMKVYSFTEIAKKMQKIKHTYGSVYSNYYYQFITANGDDLHFDVQETAKSIVFGRQDEMVYHVYFCTAEIAELKALLKEYQEEATIDIIAKEQEDWSRVFDQLSTAGYRQQATFERHHIRNLKESMYSNIPEDLQGLDARQYGRYAEKADAEEIFQILEDTFDPKESHLQSLEALEGMIEDKNIRVITENGKIVTLVTFWTQGRKLYVEHLINRGKREYAHCLYLGVLEEMNAAGINYVYTWISSQNIRIRRFISRFGYEKEGVVDYIFVKD